MRDLILSYIRTFVPVWVASLATIAADAQIDLPVEPATVVALAVVISAYYAVARGLERVPQLAFLGRLLLSVGLVGAPGYDQGGGGGSRGGGADGGGGRGYPGV